MIGEGNSCRYMQSQIIKLRSLACLIKEGTIRMKRMNDVRTRVTIYMHVATRAYMNVLGDDREHSRGRSGFIEVIVHPDSFTNVRTAQ